jgi:hypothetical protein
VLEDANPADNIRVEIFMTRTPARQPRRRGGFVLVTTAISLVGLLALIGLSTDVGRIYVARAELQVFADEAAIMAGFELDGTVSGIQRARTAATTGPGTGTAANRWGFGTQTVQNVVAQFAKAPHGPFEESPSSGQDYRFVQVQVTAPVKLYFLALAPGIVSPQTVTVSSVAGQCKQTSLGDGLAPFSPDAHDPLSPDFGFTSGQLYTLRWAPPGQRHQTSANCPGDVGYDPSAPSDRGYIDVGQGSGNAGLRDAIVNNTYSLSSPLEVGSTITDVNGEKSVTSAMNDRFNQDSDLLAGTYSQYHGNGRRLFTVAVNNGGSPSTIVGFALFFLQPSPCGTQNTSACCAEYVGSAVIGSNRKGAGQSGLYAVQLVQ